MNCPGPLGQTWSWLLELLKVVRGWGGGRLEGGGGGHRGAGGTVGR